MQNHKLTILGSGAALPSVLSNQTSQALDMCGHTYMIDCGENAQSMMRKMNVNYSKMSHIFISHLHGDHCFGLIGMISTLDLLGRRTGLTVHSLPGLEKLMRPHLDFFCKYIHYQVKFETFSPNKSEVIYETPSMTVKSVPLDHSITTCGFVFSEKPKQRHIRPDKIQFFNIPIRELKFIKDGADYVTPDGDVIPNKVLTIDPEPPKKFAYISDTAYCERIIPEIEHSTLLFHETTFLQEHCLRAEQTKHSTAEQAARIAKLADVEQLIIGHFSARYHDRNMFLKEASKIFPNTKLAKDGSYFLF